MRGDSVYFSDEPSIEFDQTSLFFDKYSVCFTFTKGRKIQFFQQ